MSTERIPVTDVAEYIRSKNAGPFRFTLDIMFREREVYERVKTAQAITPEIVAGLYKIGIGRITDFVYFDPGKAVKVTIKRSASSGAPGDTDVYGAQQHAPLLDLVLSLPDEKGSPPPIGLGSPGARNGWSADILS